MGEEILKGHTILRLANVWGGYGGHGVWDKLANGGKINGDGTHTRDYVHIDDVIRALLVAPNWEKGIYNIGTGIETSVNQVVDYLGVKKVYTDKVEEQERSCMDISETILILSDGLGWIVDRITDEMISRIPHEFTKIFYTQISTDDFIKEANQHDLVHYQNWDWEKHIDRIDEIKTPIITSIRSFRFPDYLYKIKDKVHFHTINPGQRQFFPNATYIPDGIFPFKSREFTVGFAGKPDDYKGFNLIKKACEELGCNFKPADCSPEQMQEYYDSIDLYVCASKAEGMSTPVMECLSINKPVLTTDVGIPHLLNVHKCTRETLKEGIEKFYTKNQVKDYTWENTCKQFKELYEKVESRWR